MKFGSTWKIEYLEFGATRRRVDDGGDELGFVVTGICLKGKELYFSFFSFEATLIYPYGSRLWKSGDLRSCGDLASRKSLKSLDGLESLEARRAVKTLEVMRARKAWIV